MLLFLTLITGRQGQRKAQSIKQELCVLLWSYHATQGSALALICGGVVYLEVSMPSKNRINIYHVHSNSCQESVFVICTV